MDDEVKAFFKYALKFLFNNWLLLLILIAVIILIILAASVYQIKLDDGTYEEEDWSNTQYASSQYTNSVSVDSNGNASTSMTAQELWDKTLEEDGRVSIYLDEPEELQKLMNAEIVTQYLDTRPEGEIDKPIEWDKITDINSTKVQGIIKLKRGLDDGNVITMTYKDPETFQSYIDAYNASGSDSDRQRALKYFTLEKKTIADTTATEIKEGDTILVPEGLGAYHTYMGWQNITSTTSQQYKLREQAGMNFDEEGFGRINGRYVIACTTTFGKVGDYIDFYQADGSIIKCIIGDIKSQNDEGCNEWGHENGQVIVEFVVDKSTWYNPNHVNPGTENCHPEWNQFITKAVNGGSYFDNPSFGEDGITPNENNQSEESKLKWPTDVTTITSEFGLRTAPTEGASSEHRGIDIGVSTGTNVYACESGTVTSANYSESAGNIIVIDHGNGYTSKYMHNSELLVSAGETVEKGQVIAKSGNSGISTGPHLHFEIVYNGTAVDPLSFKYDNNMGSGTGGFGATAGQVKTQYVAKVATWTETTEEMVSDDPDVPSYTTASHNMTTTEINYQEFVSVYTMPFDYLWDLLVLTEDKEFVLELADLVLDTELEITVHDNLSTNINVNTNTYTENEKIVSGNVRVTGTVGTEFVKEATPRGTKEEVRPTPRKTVLTTTTITNILDIQLTKADTWVVQYNNEYTYEIPEDIVTQGGAGDLEDIPYTDNPDHTTHTDDIGYGELERLRLYSSWAEEYPMINAELKNVTCEYYYSTTDRNETIVNTLKKTTYVKPPDAKPEEKTDKDSEEPNFVTILLDEDNLRAKRILLDSSDWFFKMLEKNPDTIDPSMIDLTKYLLYKASGKDYGVTEFDFSIFYPNSLTSVGAGDYVVHIDKSSQDIVITDLETLKRAFAGYSGSSKLIEHAQDFLDLQEEYRVNAVFAAAVSISETGAGRAGHATDGKNNWFNIECRCGGNHGRFETYSSARESIEAFYQQIAVRNYYFTEGNYTVSSIGMIYCENADAPGGWIENTTKFMTQMFNAAGITITDAQGATPIGAAVVAAAREKLGCAYVWGATGPNTFDCSGLTQWCYNKAGISIPRTSGEQKNGALRVVPVSEARIGDILWKERSCCTLYRKWTIYRSTK